MQAHHCRRDTHIANHRNVPCLRDNRLGVTRVALGSDKYGRFFAYHLRDRLGGVHGLALRVIPFQIQRYVRQKFRVLLDLRKNTWKINGFVRFSIFYGSLYFPKSRVCIEPSPFEFVQTLSNKSDEKNTYTSLRT